MMVTEQLCLYCGRPVPQSKGPIKRKYCNKACKQAEYRRKLAQEATDQQRASDQDMQARIVELEQKCYRYASHIAELEDENRKLRERLNVEARYLTDTKARAFKSWLQKHPQGSFCQRLLADARFERPRYRKQDYEYRLPIFGYSEEDIAMFRNLWKAMLIEQE